MSDKTAGQSSLLTSEPATAQTSSPVLKKEKALPKTEPSFSKLPAGSSAGRQSAANPPDGQSSNSPGNSQNSPPTNPPTCPSTNPVDRRCRQAIRHFCLECQGRLPKAVDNCEDDSCPLYLFRLNDPESRLDQPGLPIRPMRAVRQQCLACCAGERDEIRNCSAGKSCSLWEFRFGVSPAVYRRVKERLRGPRHFTLPGLNLDG